jgi:hypothetical protein
MAFVGPFSGEGYFQLNGGAIERSSNGTTVDFAVFTGNIVDGFLLSIGGQGYIYALKADGSAVRTRVAYWNDNETVTDYAAQKADPTAILLGGSTTPTPPPSGAQAHVIATDTDLTGHKIFNLAPGVAPTDGVNVSQLSALNLSLTQAIEAGDLANENAINAANVRIDNLPAGITMQMVTAEAQRLVGIAVANEITDDAQVQAIVDALITSLQNVDASILTNVSALQAQMVDLIPRVVALELAKVAQDAVNSAQTATNSAQTATNAAVQNGLASNATAIGVEAATNAAQNATLTSHAGQISAINLRLDPIVYKIRGGVCIEAINAMASQCVQSGIAGPDASYAVTLPAGRAHSVGVVYLMMGGKRVQVACGSTVDAAGLVNQFSFLNADADIVFS